MKIIKFIKKLKHKKSGLKVPFNKTHMSNLEIKSVVKALKSGWLTMGPKTIEFESDFKKFIGTNNAVSMNSATAALHLALKAINLKRYDEVIIPTTTFVSTAEVVTYFDAIPVLCDVEEFTHNIDVTKIEKLITPKTKAIIPVHFAGQPCDMDEIYSIAEKYNLKVIEDAAHAIPSKYKNISIGSLPKSDITCFSFYATKTLSTGEGGMATTNNDDYAKSMKINRLHGISRDAWDRYTLKGSWYYEVVDNGNKYNTTDINSAIGVVQLKKQLKLLNKRKRISELYRKGFANNSNIILPFVKNDRETSWHLYVIKIEKRDDVIEKLKEVGIGCSVHFIPVHKHPYYREKYNLNNEDYPVANKIFEESLSLPIYPDMTDAEIKYVINNVNLITNG
jgi:dTDP-4-amino-4,6-dideoxygalactose transaminase